jgi:DNA mismatch repair ATPase MutS
MKCYYRVYSVEEYGNSLRYSFGFEGYIDNLFGVWENLSCGNISYSDYVEKNTTSKKQFTKITEQYYPPHLGDTAVTNTCKFNKNMIISAPNAAGKTTLLKSTAINIIFSQQLGCGFYKSCSLLPYTHIHSYLNIPDTSGRDSLFQAESRRCKEIIDMVSSPENKDARHFAILDELYSGTNPTEAGKSAYAFLKYLSKYNNIDFMLTTHYVYVCKKFKKSQKICNFKMGVNNVTENGYSFTYRLEPGISKIQGAMKILQDMDYPQEMLDVIKGM